MRKLKRVSSVILTFILITTFFIGCGKSKEVTSKVDQAITVEDQLGRKVEIKGEVNKIISSYPITTSLLVALGLKDKVAGVEMKPKDRELYRRVAPEFLDKPQVGSAKSISVEECAKINPDLVIMPTRTKEMIPKFEELNIPVIAVEPESLDSFLDCVKLLGKSTNTEDRADEIVKYYEDNLEKVKKLNENNANKPKVYLSGSANILRTCTSKMYQNYMIEASGGNNVTSSLEDGYWVDISAEQLLAYNPDIIYIVQYAKYSVEDVLNDERLKDLNAVKNKKVFVIPSVIEPWDYPTPSSILGILWMTNNINPDKYSTEEFEKTAKDFYKKIFNLEVDNKDIGI
ncbi:MULTISPECIES: ABC transporter substrate-binding protein [unclassified Clostridium]|uniref:ABC transporter substrate-binding protein n=1 Tax=unclassified Clostridium TaxID=2614128 RepID=UPI0013CB0E29|nr:MULTISPECIES: ABC transporter substrate-binding protein [unclassified Clostridium]NFI93440.1 ABC transporter substrate-binding protein [Clostridium botulinum]NFO90099.1 ABC transporter substrate-binding protein [Clostridium botulinum]